jgi:hypothetical protein
MTTKGRDELLDGTQRTLIGNPATELREALASVVAMLRKLLTAGSVPSNSMLRRMTAGFAQHYPKVRT